MFYTLHLTILNLVIVPKINLELPAFSYTPEQIELERPSTEELKFKHLDGMFGML